ncbi:MAG: host-nuclease inhibitor Gam family protein [Bacteroidetes bacterium]|nr:host-nuclease inhibitor Gam family protein [Bacteroidota bacterium]
MRTSKKTKVGVTLTEAQAAAHEYAEQSIKKDKLTAVMNEKLQKVREQYEPDITACDEAMTEPVETLEAFAIEQRKNWDGKSSELGSCVIGFRTNPASVAKKKGITWDAVVGLFKANKLLKGFVKIKEDVDKAALLKEQTNTKLVTQLEKLGVTFEQEENFYVDTKKEKAA